MLAALLNTPKSAEDWNRYTFHHRTSHDLIRRAIASQRNVNLASYLIDPMAFQHPEQWLETKQQLHTEMNATLGKPGVDLGDLDIKNESQLRSWIFLHYQEHFTAEQTLGVAS